MKALKLILQEIILGYFPNQPGGCAFDKLAILFAMLY